jgi:hypothetical protein
LVARKLFVQIGHDAGELGANTQMACRVVHLRVCACVYVCMCMCVCEEKTNIEDSECG